jgi:hypothetical protein
MNRKTVVIFAVALCITAIVVGVLFYLSYNTLSPNIVPNVTITNFNLTGYDNPVGVVWNDMFLLTYVNNGTTDIDNTTITFATNSTFEMSREIGVFDSVPPHNYIGRFMMRESYPLGIIKANETKDFHGCIWNVLGDTAKVHGSSFTAVLKSNDTLLDQATIYLPGSQNPSNITCTYHEISSEIVGNDTRVVVLVTAEYNRGDQVTLKYDNFYVGPIHIQNDTYNSPLFAHQIAPFEAGSVTIDSYNRSSTFQLTFQFPTNYKGFPVSSYPLNHHLDSLDSNFIEIIYENLLNKDS